MTPFPQALRIATYISLEKNLIPALKSFESEIEKKSKEFKDIIKTGRTHSNGCGSFVFRTRVSSFF